MKLSPLLHLGGLSFILGNRPRNETAGVYQNAETLHEYVATYK